MSDITPNATNSFSEFHMRQTPMTTDEQLSADRADVMRHQIEELVAVAGTGFFDRSPFIGAINPIAAPMKITNSINDNGRFTVVGCVTFGTAYEASLGVSTVESSQRILMRCAALLNRLPKILE